jgi:hypothetical protein
LIVLVAKERRAKRDAEIRSQKSEIKCALRALHPSGF